MAQHFILYRNTDEEKEICKIGHIEGVIRTVKKHKWYIQERHGMIRSLLVPDFQLYHILVIFGAFAWTVMI